MIQFVLHLNSLAILQDHAILKMHKRIVYTRKRPLFFKENNSVKQLINDSRGFCDFYHNGMEVA